MADLQTECDDLLTGDILRACKNASIGGIESKVCLVPLPYIDIENTTFDTVNDMIMTSLELLPNKEALFVEGFRQVNAGKFEVVKKDNTDDKWLHTFSALIPNISAENKKRLVELSKGLVAVVIQTKYKGTDKKDAFHVFGFHQGMNIASATYASNENDGGVLLDLASMSDYEEPFPPYTLLDGGTFGATMTAFENRFKGTVIP